VASTTISFFENAANSKLHAFDRMKTIKSYVLRNHKHHEPCCRII